MAGRVVAIGEQMFDEIVSHNSFYVDKTKFICDWWKNRDTVTILTRPRRFGKTLLLNTVEHFLSNKYKDEPNLFTNFAISNDVDMLAEQNQWPVIPLSFACIKEQNYEEFLASLSLQLEALFRNYKDIIANPFFDDDEKEAFRRIRYGMDSTLAIYSINLLSSLLMRVYGKKVILLLDEYDTPLYEVFAKKGYASSDFEDTLNFMRGFFNASFKTNPYMSRVLMTGITHIAKQSLFSDFNNSIVITTSTNMYTDACGFTSEEMDKVLIEYDLMDQKEAIKDYYDGYKFGNREGIYNPWSISQFLKMRELKPYWISTSSDTLLTQYIRLGRVSVKLCLESLLNGRSIIIQMDESISLDFINNSDATFWSLCVATGYLRVASRAGDVYTLEFTNREIAEAMAKSVKTWFSLDATNYNSFINALISDDLAKMNLRLSEYVENTFSYFDVSGREPERFYHGFVLGLMLDLRDRYIIDSNRESGDGRYDIMLIPRRGVVLNGIIIEFKTMNHMKPEKDLHDTAISALHQIEQKKYEQKLLHYGISHDRIRKYAIVFDAKQVLIERGNF